MATYAIGDLQGCDETFVRLLARLRFDPARDRLWLTGDLVNRGPRSLEVLRRVRGLGDRAITVLGNHDLHLLARAEGVAPARARDTLDPVLAAPDHAELLDWLRARPLLHREGSLVLVHAGLLPQWTVEQAEALARQGEAALRGPHGRAFLRRLGGRLPPRWTPELPADEQVALATVALTRLRTCRANGRICGAFKGPPEQAPRGCAPWYAAPGRRSVDARVLFGHWAALGLSVGPTWIGLDSGCVWGLELSAVRLEDLACVQEPAAER